MLARPFTAVSFSGPLSKVQRSSLNYPVSMLIGAAFFLCPALPLTGCGAGISSATSAATSSNPSAAFVLSPETTTTMEGNSVSFAVKQTSSSNPPASDCVWASNDSNVLSSQGEGRFSALGVGSAVVTASCHGSSATASATVASPIQPPVLVIKKGGTYSGNFSSSDPNVPAITVRTTDPVIIENSIVTGPGDLIHVLSMGTHVGSNVTVRNVTAVATDSGLAGSHRGMFVKVEEAGTLTVTNCTMTGVSFGVYVAPNPTATRVTIDNNIAYNMEDRPSDGKGGLVSSREMKGHFIQLNQVVVSGGADLGWNQVIDTPGLASVEDIIDIAQSRAASAAAPINIHDNYLEGAISTGSTIAEYTGGGIMSEGASTDLAQVNAYILITNNVVVHTANYGIGLAYGHDITVTGNRVVSCGVDGSGSWYAGLSGVAFGMSNWNLPNFYNNHISNSTGGLVRPVSVGGGPMISDAWTPAVSTADNNTMASSAFDDPCWTSSKTVSNQAEIAERASWSAKVARAGEVLGDTHAGKTN